MRMLSLDCLASLGAFVFGAGLALAATFSNQAAGQAHANSRGGREEGAGGRGEIAQAYHHIAQRVGAARAPTRRLRGVLTVRLGNVLWRDAPQRPFLRAQRVQGALDLAGAERGDIIIGDVLFQRAEVLLRQTVHDGPWNYERVLADLLEDDDSDDNGERSVFRLNDVRVQDTNVYLQQPGTDVVFSSLDVRAPRIQFSAPDASFTEIDVAQLYTVYEDRRTGEQMTARVEAARLQLPEGRVVFQAQRAALDSTRVVDLAGRWEPGAPGLGLDIAGRATDVRFADLRFLTDLLPEEGRGSFTFDYRSLTDDRSELRVSDADVNAGDSHLLGGVALRLGGPQLEVLSVDARLDPLSVDLVERVADTTFPWDGYLTGTVRGADQQFTFGVDALLTTDALVRHFDVRLDGSARRADGSFTLQRLQAGLRDVPAEALRPIAPGLPLSGLINGTVTLTGPPARAPLTLDVRLELAGGSALVRGTLDLTGAEPSYDLTGQLVNIDLQRVLEPEVPATTLTAQFALRGRSFQPERADARVEVAGTFAGGPAQPGDVLRVNGRVQNGALALDTATLLLLGLRLEARGQWRFVAPETGALRYSLAVAELSRVAPYLPGVPESAAGSLQAQGTVAGTLDRMRVQGELDGEDVVLAGWDAATLHAKYDLAFAGVVPELKIAARAERIESPSAGTYATASLDLELDAPKFELEFQADHTERQGRIEIAASGRIPHQGARHLVLQRVLLDLADNRWTLAQPAAVDWGVPNDGVRITDFDLRSADGTGRLRLDGRLLPLAQIDARVETSALPLEDVQRLAGRQPVITGELWAKGQVRGGRSPSIDVELRVDTGTYERVGFSRVEGRMAYRDGLLTGSARMMFDTAGVLDARASLPLLLSFEPAVRFEWLSSGEISAALVADSLALAPMVRLFPEVRDVEGVMSANATLSGTMASPVLDGRIDVVGGAFTVVPLDRRYTDITAEIAFDRRGAQLLALRARSDGWLEGSGRVDFPQLDNPQADLSIALDGFRVAGVEDRDDAQARGNVRIAGPLANLTMTGAVTFENGDVPIPQFGRSTLDRELESLELAANLEQPGAAPGGGILENLRIEDFRLRAGSGLWVSMRNARAQLAGELTINKTADDIRILGTLEGQRGTYTLEAGPIIRRFEIVHAEVRFLGTEEINPALDITARRLVLDPAGREMDVQVRVGGTLQSPTLSLASGDAAQIPQSELLSFLLFGESTLGLGGNHLPGETLIQETFLSGVAELASLELESALGAPFDVFQIRLGGGRFGGLGSPTLVLGRELGSDVFLTVESGIATLFGPGADETVTNTWAVRLEWRIDANTSLRVGYEPVNRTRLIRGIGVALPINRRQQGAVELRRRWSW